MHDSNITDVIGALEGNHVNRPVATAASIASMSFSMVVDDCFRSSKVRPIFGGVQGGISTIGMVAAGEAIRCCARGGVTELDERKKAGCDR